MVYTLKTTDFDGVRLRLASPEQILDWSHGEVLKPETINYRTQKPEKEGLFCERIFGPSKDWECYCGKYKKIRYKGLTCDKCGVEVTRAIVRRERMGHISLAIPVSHIWYLRGVPSKLGLILDISMQNLEKVIYFANFIITYVDHDAKAELLDQLKTEYKSKKKKIIADFAKREEAIESEENDATVKTQLLNDLLDEKNIELNALDEDFKTTEKEIKDLKERSIVSESQYKEMSLRYGYLFRAGIGAEAIRELLEKTDLDALIAELDEELEDAVGAKRKKLIKRVRLLKGFRLNKINPEWMVLTELPVIPPDLRPMVALDGGRFATSDLNDLYRRVINRNNRLKRLQDLNAPEVICRNEKRMLQEAVDALIDNNARRTKTTTASTGQKRQLKSLADILKGKQGRFRQNLLGKRIDYSGRSVIVVGPTLNMGQCGIPKRMALELFRPFIISKLISRELVHNIRSANRFIEGDRPEVWDILEEVVADAFVMLNRAPTLHRLGIQAFRPVLIEGKAIQLHPLVCSAFNADFDGDQMAVHVPLTEEARDEARNIMLSSHNLLKPATGKPIANPSHDMSWGIFYITRMQGESDPQKIRAFSNVAEAKTAYGLEQIKIYDPINVLMTQEDGSQQMVVTCLGRIMFSEILPDEIGFINETVDKKGIGRIISQILEYLTFEETAVYVDKIKNLGFKYITKSGYSWGMGDLPELTGKYDLVAEGNEQEEQVRQQYEMGLLTRDEKHSKVVEIWTAVKDKVTKLSQGCLDETGSVYSMITSGSRGSWGQLTQMVGMKGLVSNPSGEIIELPVKSNFREGFEVLEYFIATHGTRKGLADTALRTANAGYLTRRLVDVAQDVVINAEDCGESEGKIITKADSERLGDTVLGRIAGRFVLQDVADKDGNVVVKAGELVTAAAVEALEGADLENIRVRSVLSCKLLKGLCQKCYGLDLARNKLVNLGAAVGIVAAQSIGEPGTQLTMRTFHTGGVASAADITQGLPRVEELFESRTPKFKAFMAEFAGTVNVIEQPKELRDEDGKVIISTTYGQKIVNLHYNTEEIDVYKIKKDYTLQVKEGDKVEIGDVVLLDQKNNKIKAKRSGVVSIEKKKLKVSLNVDKVQEYIIPQGYVLWVKDGDTVEQGQQLTEGALDLQQLFKLRGKKAVEDYVTSEIQHIYSSQGQKLNDKHIEIIIRQLFSRVYLRDPGQTDLLPGEIVEKSEMLEANALAERMGLEPATYDELFLGISKVSLSTRSFLSAASFQETSKVLINASVTGKIDKLEGLKENVIIGRLIPAGTGFREVKEETAETQEDNA